MLVKHVILHLNKNIITLIEKKKSKEAKHGIRKIGNNLMKYAGNTMQNGGMA